MKVKDIIKKIDDKKLYIEIVENGSGASFGFYTKNDLIYNDRFNADTIKSINVQYIDGKRLLVLKIK